MSQDAKLQALVYDTLPLEVGAGKQCSEYVKTHWASHYFASCDDDFLSFDFLAANHPETKWGGGGGGGGG